MEQAAHGDITLVDAPETHWLIKTPTKYSGYTKLGRGMPTFKQFAFFEHAARHWPGVKFVGKVACAPRRGAPRRGGMGG